MIEGMKQTDIGFIPREWNTLKFGEIFDIVKSHSFSRNKLTSEETSTQVYNIHYGDIHSKFTNNHLDFDTENVPFILDEFLTNAHNQFLKDGDIVIADVSEDLIDIGKCVELKNVRDRKVIGGLHTIVARDKSKNVEKGFGAYIFKHHEVLKELRSIATGMSVYGISKGNLNKLFIPVPPLPEQRKIAYVLSTVQKAIEQQDKLIRHTTELKKALMQKLFTEGTKGEKQKQTEIGLVPESWEVTTIGAIASVTSGGTPSRKENIFWENGNIPWVKTGEVNYCIINTAEEYITELGLKNSSAKIYPKGTLLMAMYGQGITRGKVAILGIDATINQACAAIMPKKNSHVLSEYLYYFFEHNYDYVRGLSHGANQKNLSGNIIKDIEVSYPKDITKQKFIVSSLKCFDNKKLVYQKKKQTLSDLFKTLLYELMTGERRVHEIEFEALPKAYKIKEQPLSMAAEK